MADRPGTVGENEEGRLGGLLGIVVIAEDPLAGPEDHPPVAGDDRLERRLARVVTATTVGEPLEQLAVAQSRG